MHHYSLSEEVKILSKVRTRSLQCAQGHAVDIHHYTGSLVPLLAKHRLIDCVIVESEDGFSQLGMMRSFVSSDLGLTERDLVKHVFDGFPDDFEKNISSLADWNRFRNPNVTLVAIPSERDNSFLKGLILVPHDSSACYKQFAGWNYGTPRPYRDFFYNITYEAISHAYHKWGCKNILVTHFSSRKCRSIYHPDLTTCQLEAMVHFCKDHPNIKSFTFLDDDQGNQPLKIVEEFNELDDTGAHRKITKEITKIFDVDFINITLPSCPGSVT